MPLEVEQNTQRQLLITFTVRDETVKFILFTFSRD
jgi:hypothetical protein